MRFRLIRGSTMQEGRGEEVDGRRRSSRNGCRAVRGRGIRGWRRCEVGKREVSEPESHARTLVAVSAGEIGSASPHSPPICRLNKGRSGVCMVCMGRNYRYRLCNVLVRLFWLLNPRRVGWALAGNDPVHSGEVHRIEYGKDKDGSGEAEGCRCSSMKARCFSSGEEPATKVVSATW